MLRFLMQNLLRLHRGFIEASSRLSKTIGFSYAKPIEASSRLYQGFQNVWYSFAKPIEAASRLHRGLQKRLVLQCTGYRGFIEASRVASFYVAGPQLRNICPLNIERSNLSLTESVRLRWLFRFELLCHLGTGPGLKFYSCVCGQGHWLPLEASLRLSI